MVVVLGSSTERVFVKDLNDTIYYKQKKEYTDQQYENSKDLKKEIRKGRLVKLERVKSHSNASSDFDGLGGNSPQISEIKDVMREVLSEIKTPSTSSAPSGDIRDILPLIISAVGQEVSKQVSGLRSVSSAPESSAMAAFKESGYIPDISTEGMKSSINVDERKEVKGGTSVSDSLAALKNLKKK